MRHLDAVISRIKKVLNRVQKGADRAERAAVKRFTNTTYLHTKTEGSKILFLLWDGNDDMPNRFRKYLAFNDKIAPFFLLELSLAIRSRCLIPPKFPAEIYEIVEHALRDTISRYQNPEDVANNLKTFNGRYTMAECARFIRIFRFTGLQKQCCQLMILLEHGGFRGQESELQQWHILTRSELIECFSSMPPEAIPAYWQNMRDPELSSIFWPVLEKMNSHEAIPFMLELLPNLTRDRQKIVIAAFQRIGDIRAVPALQKLAASQTDPLAPSASRALASILKNSGEDAAQLLRASSAENSAGARETLLRAALPTITSKIDSSELLRHFSMCSERDK